MKALDDARIERAAQVLRRHGATKRQAEAFAGTPRWPGFPDIEDDPVVAVFKSASSG